jgi:hypothetical protein
LELIESKGREDKMEDWPFWKETEGKPKFGEWVRGVIFGIIITFSIYYFIFSNALKMRMGVK